MAAVPILNCRYNNNVRVKHVKGHAESDGCIIPRDYNPNTHLYTIVSSPQLDMCCISVVLQDKQQSSKLLFTAELSKDK